MTQSRMPGQDRDHRLQAILHAYLQAIDRGERPDRQKVLDANPELRDELAEYFADASKLEQLAKSLQTATFSDDAPSLAVSRTLGKIRYFGDYELLEEIARGGMGVVFKAKQVSLNRVVALKMILKGELANDADVRRFRQEAEAAANLDHPNIVPIYEVGEHEGQQYFSMKLIEVRQTVLSTAADKNVCPTAAATLAKVARAVHHAHQRGILHRDLKPSNILIDKSGEPHVADFGLAKKVEGGEDATKSGAIVGTPAYMAPEQARAEKSLTTAVDIYSLGAVLYEWLTGRPPFRGDDAISTLMKVVNDEPAKPRTVNARIARDMETICLKCLEKDPAKRYSSALAMAEDLERWRRGEPITARRAGRVERTWRWCRRNPLLAAVSMAACLGALLALYLFGQGYVQDQHQAYRAGLREATLLRQAGRLDEARRVLKSAPRIAWAHVNPEWRGAAVALVTTPEMKPIRQVHLGKTKSNDDMHNATLTWEDNEHVRVHLGPTMQLRRITGELLKEGPIALEPKRAWPAIPNLEQVLGRSRDGNWVVARLKIDAALSVVLWDMREGKITHTLPDVGRLPSTVVVAPDGRRLAYIDPHAPTTVRIWDWQAECFTAVLAHSEGLGFGGSEFGNAGGFSPDGEVLCTYGATKRGRSANIQIWQTETGERLGEVPQVFDRAEWGPDSRHLAIVGGPHYLLSDRSTPEGAYLQIWELRYPSRTYQVDERRAGSLRLHKDQVIWGGRLWALTKRGDAFVLERGAEQAREVSNQPDGSRWRFAKDVDVKTGEQTIVCERLEPNPWLRSLTVPDTALPEHLPGRCRHVRLWGPTRDYRHLLLATEELELRPSPRTEHLDRTYNNKSRLEWWDFEKGKGLAVWNEGNEESNLERMTLTPTGRSVVTFSSQGMKIWDTATGKIRQEWPRSPANLVHSALFASISGEDLLMARFETADVREGRIYPKNTEIEFLDVDSGERRHHLTLNDWSTLNDCRPLAFHWESGWLAAINRQKELELWNFKTGKLWAFWAPHENQEFGATFHADGKLLYTTSHGALRLWNLEAIQRDVAELEPR